MKRTFLQTGGSVAMMILLLAATASGADDPAAVGRLVYSESNGRGGAVNHNLRQVDRNHFELQTELGGKNELQLFVLNDSGETREWRYRDEGRSSDFSARLLPGRIVSLNGTHRGKPVARSFEISGQPWNQLFQHGLKKFLASTGDKTVFWAIGTRGKGELKITRFTVTKMAGASPPEDLLRNGRRGPFRHLKISLYGLLSIFWSGHYWYDGENGAFLYYRGKSSYLEGEVMLQLVEDPGRG